MSTEFTYEKYYNNTNGNEIYTVNEHDGIEGEIFYDEYPESPRTFQDNVGTMAVSYRGYDLGDEEISAEQFEIDCEHCDGQGEIEHHPGPDEPPSAMWEDCPSCEGFGRAKADPVAYFKKERGARVVLPLIVYEHSGITMKVGHVGDIVGDSAGWDTSFVGFIFDTPEWVEACMGECTDEQLERALRAEVEEYAAYLEGNVHGFRVTDDVLGTNESCYGFVGDRKYCEEEMLMVLKGAIEYRVKENNERQYWLEREVMTV